MNGGHFVMGYRILSVFAIVFLISSGIGTASMYHKDNVSAEQSVSRVVFSHQEVLSQGDYVSVDIDNANAVLMGAGKPMLPVYAKTFIFPLGTRIKSVECEMLSSIEENHLSGKIQPAPQPVPFLPGSSIERKTVEENIVEDRDIYSRSTLFPEQWYDYTIGCGLDEDTRVVFLTVRYYPVRYAPADDTIYSASGIDIKITYEPSSTSVTSADKYDLVIIAPKMFSRNLRPLIAHKNNNNVDTILKTTEEIYDEYDGRDKPEQIKYFIKDAVEEWGIKYVLLVGGMKGQRNTWHVPVRYSNLDDNQEWDFGYISDLYYADIYKYENSNPVFDDWDSNGNNIFAEWNKDSTQKDILDLHPDVYVGRLACRNIIEVANAVKKIITYETQTHGKAWFNHMILVAGDTFPNKYNVFEGQLEANRSASYMASLDVDVTRLFASDGTLTQRKDVIQTMNQGSGFMHFAGHGNPSIWSTYPPNDIDTWIDGLSIADMGRLRNRNKLPICVIGGCHTHKFDVTILDVLHGVKEDGLHYFSADEDDSGSFWLFEWVPECLGWRLISKRNVGAIATIGNTGLGFGYPGNSTLQGLGGWIEPRFFHAVGVQGKTTLGEAHSQVVIDYVNTFDVHGDRIDCKTVQQWVLLGDPSLKLGGYSS
jgi:hypothetical protein